METTSSGRAWDQATYYQLLLGQAMRVPLSKLEQIERLAVLLLVGLLVENGGRIQWPLAQIRAEISISEAALNKTIKKLLKPNNPFWSFVQIRREATGKHYSYHISLVNWVSDEVTSEEAQPAIDYARLPIPTSLAEDLPHIFAHFLEETLWQSEKRFDDIIVQVKVLRTKDKDKNSNSQEQEVSEMMPVARSMMASMFAPFTADLAHQPKDPI